jgi:hypothetical protein
VLVSDLLDEIRSEDRLSAARAKAYEAEIADLRKQVDLISSLDRHAFKPPRWMAPPKSNRDHRGTVCALLTDTHFQEIVRPTEIDYLNAYNDEIAERRLRAFTEGTIKLARDYVSGIAYDGMVLMWGGDIFTGTIHDELNETNSQTLYEAVVHWIEALLAMERALADQFGAVHNEVTFGNHGRDSKKPRAKQRAAHNIEWLLYKWLERETKADKRITWHIPDSADTLFTIYDTRYLLTHGDQFRGGSGIAGALSPLLLGSHRKTRRAAASGRPFDIMVMGHFHQYLTLPGLIVGGSLKGLDEYAYLGNFGYEPPRQAFWITTPQHGVTLSAPIHVLDRAAEGW